MKLIDKTTKVPARSLPGERDAEGNLTNAVRAHFGRAALEVGTPDHGLGGGGTDGCRTDAVDTVMNILHWLHHRGIDPAPILESAIHHFRAEISPQTVESQAVGILKDAGLNAYLQHTGGGVWVAEVRSKAIPGRIVWVTDSKSEPEGAFLVGVYPSRDLEAEAIDSLSGACTEAELVAKVRRGLQHRLGDGR